MNTVKALHDKGMVFVWTVTDPHVETSCEFAWITYTNRGSVRNASGTQSLSWLESAMLQKTSRNMAHPLLPQHTCSSMKW
ncbi:MAG TPA: hypothetical protein VF018_16210 [Acidobacteriaceae bacterium]